MRKMICLFVALFALAGCDAPTATRQLQATPVVNGDGATADPTTTTGTTSTSTTTTGGTTTGLGAGFANCNINPTEYVASIGYVSACQSTLQENHIKMQFSETDLTSFPYGTCLVPMHRYQDGNSRYIGPYSYIQHTKNTVYSGYLSKYASESINTINALVIIKCKSLNAFFNCMDAAALFIAQYCPTNVTANCQSQAQIYMNQQCGSFVSQHELIQINF